MAVTFNTYSGNGTTGPFSFTFEYIDETDVKVSIDAVTQSATAYTFPTASTIQFVSLTPTASQTIRIFRDTDVDELKATFFAGSSIRSQDLNDNFEQNNFAVQEIKAQYVTKENGEFTTNVDLNNNRLTDVGDPVNAQDAVTKQYLEDNYFDDDTETILSTETWPGNNTTIATTLAIDGRVDSKIDTAIEGDILVDSTGLTKTASGGQVTLGIGAGSVDLDRIKDADIITSSETNPNNDTTIATTAKIDDMIDDAVTNDILIESNGLTKSTSGGQTTLGIGAGAVDLDRIKSDDIVATSAYSSTWTSEDDKIVTAGALAARHDVVVNTDVNPPSTAQVGKQWLSTAPGNQVHKIYDGSGWRTVAVGQPFSPATTTVVRYVDVTNGSDASDVTGFLPQAPLQSIGRALELINASASGDGSLIKVAPGVYQETLPLRIKKNNISIVGESMRSCFVHPTVATENNDMFEVDSGSYIANLTLLGLKVPTANQSSRNNSLDNDSTYGLPSNQPFSIRFRTDTQPVILKSPYIQNCTHFSDAHFDNANFDPNTFPSTDSQTYSAVAGDQTSAPCGGGLLIDGSAVSSSSPVRSMVVDAFTQICLDGPGVLVTNNGYAQLVSFFGTFTHYHAKAKNGGQINLSNCVSDFGRYGLIADGKSPSAIASATASAANSGATTITIGAITTDSGFHGTVSRPLDHMMVTIDGVDYGVVSSTANGSGWDIVLTSGLTSNITNTTVSFALRSYISTGGHTFEFVGVGTDYSDHPDNGGVPVEANQVIELNGGKVWQSSTDHVGKFKAGDVLVVDQVSETVDLKDTTVTGNITVTGTVDGRDVAADGTKLDGIATGAIANVVDDTTPQLGGNLDVNGNDIVSVSNGDIDLDPNGSGVVVFKGNSTKGSGQFKLNCEQNSHGITIKGPPHSAAASYTLTLPNTDGNANEVLQTDGSGALSWVAQSGGGGASDINGLSDARANTTAYVHLGTNAGGSSTTGTALGINAGYSGLGGGSVYLGFQAGYYITGTYNTFVGDGAGLGSSGAGVSPDSNTGMGYQTLYSLSSGDDNVGIGYQALRLATSGRANVAIGIRAGDNLTTGTENIFIGPYAGDNVTTGSNNITLGWVSDPSSATVSNEITLGNTSHNSLRIPGLQSGATNGQVLTYNSTNGNITLADAGGGASDIDGLSDAVTYNSGQSIGIGANALDSEDGGEFRKNTAVGYDALTAVTTGQYNVALGYQAGKSITTSSYNTAIGVWALRDSNQTNANSASTAVGYFSQPNATTGSENTSVGYRSAYTLTTGNYNVAVGNEALEKNTTASYNTAVGYRASEETTDGHSNTSVGYEALTANTGGDENSAFGSQALKSSTTAANNSAFGQDALRSTTTGGSNVAVGKRAGRSSTTGQRNTFLGYSAGFTNTTGTDKVVAGYNAGYSTNANGVVFLGAYSGQNSTGAGNTGVGYYCMYAGSGTMTGTNNTSVGDTAAYNLTTGSNNTLIGKNAGDTITTGSNNICIGQGSDSSSYSASNEITLGNNSNTSLRIPGLQSGATNGEVLTYNSTNGDIELANPIPAGTVIHTVQNTAPSGYLKANGANVSRTTYAALFAVIGTTYGSGDGSTTFGLPDLRGEFIRSWDDGRGVDSGRSINTTQSDELKSHSHSYTYAVSRTVSDGGVSGAYPGSTSTGATGGTETRPRNIALLACIKY